MATISTQINIEQGRQSATICQEYLFISDITVRIDNEVEIQQRITDLEHIIEVVKKQLTDRH